MGKIKIKYKVNIVVPLSQFDVFIYGIHDFRPITFETLNEALEWISQNKEEYTITEIYSSNEK